jgi:hypothetical protein
MNTSRLLKSNIYSRPRIAIDIDRSQSNKNVCVQSDCYYVSLIANRHVNKSRRASSLLQLIGLSGNTNATGVPNYGPAFILANWAYAYCLLSTRLPKRLVNIDHNTNPREDIARYGVAAVAAGKISRARLDRIKRMQAAHENAVEGFPFFVAAREFLSIL